MDEQHNTAWIPLYAPDGGKIHFTINLDTPLTEAQVQVAQAAYAILRQAGFTPREPGLEDGEQSETAHYIVRRAKGNDDGTETPVLDLYPDKFKFRALSVYLNTDDDVAAFEAASGVKLASLPTYDSSAPLERGKDARLDKKYVIALPRPLVFIHMANPAYDEDVSDPKRKKPKRKFVRWQTSAAANVVNIDAAKQMLGNGDDRRAVKPEETKPLNEWFDWKAVSTEVRVWFNDSDDDYKANLWALITTLARDGKLKPTMTQAEVEQVIIEHRPRKAVNWQDVYMQTRVHFKARAHFDNAVASMKQAGELRDDMTVEQAVEAINAHYAEKQSA